MAASSAEVYHTNREFQADVTATADADTGLNVAHGLGRAPERVDLLPIHAAARLSLWAVTSVTATNIVLSKATTAGSGNANAQLRVTASLRNDVDR